MREVTISSVNHKGEVVNESVINVDTNSKILLHHSDNLTMDSVHEIHKYFVESLMDSDKQVISLPEATKISVIQIG
jgi:hypothetical protein